jgi:catechol 2,3-dioxygenase-like lactoylglutathione lyase family enzyme
MITALDHLVLTVHDPAATQRLYCDGLGMELRRFGAAGARQALHFGDHKINLHVAGHEFEPKALHPTPGSADLCFLTATPLDQVAARLAACGFAVIEGPVARSGAQGPIVSLYLRDPDGNLIEIARPAD